MAYTNYAALVASIAAPYNVLVSTSDQITGMDASSFQSTWLTDGAAPTTAAVPTKATAGGLLQHYAASPKTARIVSASANVASTNAIILCDRLSHQGGLDATVTTEQTTNLPTAALTRYTDGVNVQLGIEIYTTIGTTATTISARYTNSAGTGSRATPLVVFGGTGFRLARHLFWLPLQSGDVGVKSVEGVTVTATTGTAGAFGVVLFKPLPIVHQFPTGFAAQHPIINCGGFMPTVDDNACLWAVHNTSSTIFRTVTRYNVGLEA